MTVKIPPKYRPVDIIPFRISNLDSFIIKSHKEYFPLSKEYDLYWTDQIKSCVEGHWGLQKNGEYRYMPGSLYFYGNMCTIQITNDHNQRVPGRPFIRDVDWYLSYGLTTCEGFSGFSSDKNYSCYRPLKNANKPELLREDEKMLLKRYDKYLRKPNGEYKEYIEAREYLYSTFKEKQSGALYLNEAQNMLLLSTRRLGKSYNIADQCLLYDLVFNGAKTLKEFLEKSTSTTTVVGSESYEKSEELLDKVELSLKHLKLKLGAYYKDGYEIPGALYSKLDGFNERENKFLKSFKEKGGTLVDKKTDTKVVHVSYKDNDSAGVGHGARKMIVEEIGLLPNFLDVHRENSAVQIADYKYGYSIYIGTGGDIEKIKGVREAFYDPTGFDILSYENLFEKQEGGIGLFFPCYYKNNDFRDPDGNLDVEKSFLSEWQKREEKKRKDSSAYQGHIISFPLLPSEMFMQSQGNRFQTNILENNLRRLESGDWAKNSSIGTLSYVDKKNRNVVWREDVYKSLTPITRLYQESKLKLKDKAGAIVVYEHPKSYRPQTYTRNPLYIAVYDPVAVQGEEGMERGTSLACVLIIKLWDFDDPHLSYNVVAEWFGRYETMDDMHEQAFKMADYYNCRLLPEVENEDILRYSKRIGRYYDLEDSPALSVAELTKKGSSNNKKGILLPRNKDGKGRMEKFLFELLENIVDRKEKIVGTEFTRVLKRVVENIPSMRMNEELINYNRDGNFDGVSAYLLAALFCRNKALEPISEFESEKKGRKEKDFKKFINTNASSSVTNTAFNY